MFYDFGGKTCFWVFGVTRFCSFGTKTRFSGFAEDAFWHENMFTRVSQKMRFGGKICFYGFHENRVWREMNFDEKTHFQFWRENAFRRKNMFCGFGGKTCFCVLEGKRVLAGKYVLAWKRVFVILAWKHVFAGKHVFAILCGNQFLEFWRENFDFRFSRKNAFLWFCQFSCVTKWYYVYVCNLWITSGA